MKIKLLSFLTLLILAILISGCSKSAHLRVANARDLPVYLSTDKLRLGLLAPGERQLYQQVLPASAASITLYVRSADQKTLIESHRIDCAAALREPGSTYSMVIRGGDGGA